MARGLLAGLILGAALAGCGDGGDTATKSSQGGVPDYASVKRLAVATRPLDACRGGTEEDKQTNPPGGDEPNLAGGSKVLHCRGISSPFVRYLVFQTEADRDKEIRELGLEHSHSPYFVNGRTLVHVEEADPTAKPSPLAQQIKDECDCGDVQKAGKPLN